MSGERARYNEEMDICFVAQFGEYSDQAVPLLNPDTTVVYIMRELNTVLKIKILYGVLPDNVLALGVPVVFNRVQPSNDQTSLTTVYLSEPSDRGEWRCVGVSDGWADKPFSLTAAAHPT